MTEDASQRSRIMASVKSADTAPERLVRHVVHGMGYRYSLRRRDLPGSPDLAFPARLKVIFVHGCFWHGHGCARGKRVPRNNRDYWIKKIAGNRLRDATAVSQIHRIGWRALVIWECELGELRKLTIRLRRFLSD